MANVIRQDIVQIGFDADLGELTKLTNELDELKKSCNAGVGDDTFDDFIKDTKKAVNGTDDVGDELKKGSTNAKKFKGALEDAADTNFSKLTNGINKATSALGKGVLAAGKVMAKGVAAGTVALGGLSIKSLSMAGDLEQNLGGSEAVFGKYASDLQDKAKTAFSSMGLSQSEYLATANKMGSLFKGAGFETSEAMKISSDAMQRAADVASIMGIDMDMAMESIAGAAKGNFTMMDNLGVAINDTTLQAYAQEKGLGKLETTQQKVNAAMQLFLEKTKDYDGNYVKENETFAGSLQTLKASFSNFMSGSGSIDDVIVSLKGFGKVIGRTMPDLVKNLVSGLTTAFKELAPMMGPVIKNAIATIVKMIYEGFTGKKMSGDMFSELTEKVSSVFNSIKKIISSVISFGQQLMSKLAPVLQFIGDLALTVFTWLADNMDTILPIVTGLIGAFLAYKAVMVVVTAVKAIMATTSAVLAKILPKVSSGVKTTGTSAAASGKQMLTSAKAFMMMGAGVLMVAAGFALLAFSSIALANAGWGAIAVMLGMVVALVALGYGMTLVLKTLSTLGPSVMSGATAMLLLGVAVLLVAAGFALLTFSAIALANAGWGAIAVLVGLVAIMALLAIGAALLGTALTAGAIGFIAFGAAMLLAGVGALLAAVGLLIIANSLSLIAQNGTSAAGAILALGASLLVFAVGAALAAVAMAALVIPLTIISAALLICGAGVLAFGVGLMLIGTYGSSAATGLQSVIAILPKVVLQSILGAPALIALGAALTVFGAGAAVAAAGTLALGLGLTVAAGGMTLLSLILPVVTANATTNASALTQLALALTAFGLGATTAGVAALLFSASVLTLTVSFAALMLTFTVLAPMVMIFAASMMLLTPMFQSLAQSVPPFAEALKPLPKAFTKLILPAALLIATLAPVAVEFAAVSIAATKFAAALITMLTTLQPLAQGITMLMSLLNMMPGTFNSSMMLCVAIITLQTSAMVRAFKLGGVQMNRVVQDTVNQIRMTLLLADLSSSGAQLMNGLIRGMLSKKSALIATARSIAQAINREFDKVQDINSPSGVWESKGEYLLQGGINGMLNKLPAFESMVHSVGEVATPYGGRYSPEGSTTSYSRSSNYESNTYAPVFNLTVSGTSDDRTTARKVKRWVQEAINDTFEGMASKNKPIREV